MKILVTGGAGFIGSHIVDAYIGLGHEVVVFDNLSTGKITNLHPLARLVVGDITTDALDALMNQERFDVVSHHAAHMELRVSVEKPLYDANTNILGSIRLLEAARRTGVKQVIVASSLAVVGEFERFPADEEHPTVPISPYGASKLSVEHYVQLYRNIHGMSITCFRYTTVYGPRQNPNGESGVVAIFLKKFLEGAKATIHGDGNQMRDYIFVQDVVSANVVALEQPISSTYFLASETDVSVNDVVTMLSERLTVPCKVVNGPEKAGDPRRTLCTSKKFTRDTGWHRMISIDDGISETVRWFESEFSKTLDSSASGINPNSI